MMEKHNVNIIDRDEAYTSVEDMREVDLTPIYLDKIVYENVHLIFTNPIVLTPYLDEFKQLYCIEYPDLGIDIFASTRKELEDELVQQVRFLWETYTQCSGEMTEQAKTLKTNLNNMIQEIRTNGSK